MEGRHFAIIASVFFWGLACLICLFLARAQFLDDTFLRNRIPFLNRKKLPVLILATMAGPFMAALAYRVGGSLEEGQGIAWGCYIEDFLLIAFILWFLGSALLVVLMLLGVFRTKKREYSFLRAFLAGILLPILYAFLMIFLTGFAINNFSGPLSGKGSTCL